MAGGLLAGSARARGMVLLLAVHMMRGSCRGAAWHMGSCTGCS